MSPSVSMSIKHLGSLSRVSLCSGENEEDIPATTGTGLGRAGTVQRAICNRLQLEEVGFKYRALGHRPEPYI